LTPDGEALTAEDLRFTPPTLSIEALTPFLLEHFNVSGEFKPLDGERDQNFRVTTRDGERYVLKVASPLEDATLVDFQVQALLHIEQSDPGVPVPRLIRSSAANSVERLPGPDGENYAVRLLSYVSGLPLYEFDPPTLTTIQRIGRLQGRLCRALQDFTHIAESHFMPWDSMNGLVLSRNLREKYLPPDLRVSAASTFKRLEENSFPLMNKLPSQVIHNDAHSGNLLCEPDSPTEISGLIDFGDMIRRPLLIDLATSLASIVERNDDPRQAARSLIEGFTEFVDFPANQRALLFDAIAARLLLTVMLLDFRVKNTDAPASLGEIDLVDTTASLRRFLSINTDSFLQAIQ
jgi:hydroxylysine kinase